ncbi:hypothetical protein, partial [Nonomuraea sp. SBT364]|uniref:hypothetical protein n=1 Tax=Nonomuraea sp. SBT364 TaxID=1580530 RepID=UPI00066BE7F6
ACPAPTELRLVTAPENVVQLREHTRRYVRENRRSDGCPAVHMTVAAAPPPVHLRDAFANNWERVEDRRGQPYARLYDLQPDAWVATSSAGPDELRAKGITWLGDGSADVVVGQDELVLAMTESRREELLKRKKYPDRYPLPEVWRTLRDDMGMTIARPFPETSMSALIGTDDLVQGLKLTSGAYEKLEKELVADGLGADTVNALLCEFGRLSAPLASKREMSDGPKIALLVPSHSLADYNAGRVEGCADTSGGERLIAVHHPAFSKLEYHYVGVSLRGQLSKGRQDLVRKFGEWLRTRRLFPDTQVAGTVKADKDRLARLETQLLDHLRPELDLRLLVDTSGSADRPVRVQAAESLRGQSRILGPRDHVEVLALGSPEAGGRADVTEIAAQSSRQQLGAVSARIEDTAFDQWDAPISAALGQVGDPDESVASPVVLLTDGRLFDNENGAGAASSIGRALQDASSVSGLYVVVFGQNRCAVPELIGTGKPYRCVLAGDRVAETITRAIITVRGWR